MNLQRGKRKEDTENLFFKDHVYYFYYRIFIFFNNKNLKSFCF